MAANNGSLRPLRLRRLMEWARVRAAPVRRQHDAPDSWSGRIPSRYLSPDSDDGLYAAYAAEPVDEAEREFTAEAREIMGLDPGSGY